MLFKKNKINHVEGFAKFVDAHTIEVEKDGKTQTLRAKNFILAMGSSVIYLTIPGLEGKREDGVWTSDDAVTAPSACSSWARAPWAWNSATSSTASAPK